ncbi:chlorophyll synthesis pathway protein BchC [Cryptococcus bacillisporus CA1873]|uniref:Chlorophyll synthesis pathway protein BchC n=1 Tax=Cryptococcus bacillisporus CA1873 TaxID=1296111 RepID=A0ABR5BDA8_CRYGA|nr:chlorophyll synthesis pathway protein BchC [Cryptococcus bacillisporus CA1873]|eukprot:KIR67157.1 chlorophyll synthesis pathway protein BchC [Cryptococcus gattii CA1873]
MSTELNPDNTSFVLHGVEDVRFDQRPIPEIHNDQVLVKVVKTGICGSDVHYLQHGRIGSFVLEEPMCLGHESSGVVVKLGPNVREDLGVKVGTRVAMEPGVCCRSCANCKAGLYELCPYMSFAATPPTIFGTLCRYYVLPADLVHPLPESVSFEDGAMMEPLSVGVHSVATLGRCKSDQTVIVFGAGPVGLLCMAVARALGARRVIALDINKERLDFAKSYAATDVCIPGSKKDDEDGEAYTTRVAGELRQQLGIPERGKGAIDLAIEASGAPTCVQIGLAVLKPAGTYVQVGMGAKMTVPVPLFHIISKQLHVVGSFRYGSGDYPLAISLVERGLINLKPLVTQRFKFEDAKEAFEATKAGKDKDGKGVIKCIINGPE